MWKKKLKIEREPRKVEFSYTTKKIQSSKVYTKTFSVSMGILELAIKLFSSVYVTDSPCERINSKVFPIFALQRDYNVLKYYEIMILIRENFVFKLEDVVW